MFRIFIKFAILGLDFDTVTDVAEKAAQGQVCQVANANDPAQNVVSGDKDAVERATVLAKDAGAKRALLLPVSAPFHCALIAVGSGSGAFLNAELSPRCVVSCSRSNGSEGPCL